MKFSIVTPCFNSGKFIAETIESVISQAGQFEIEYIIQDGGSTDDSVAIIKKYAECIENGSFPIQCTHVHLVWSSEKDGGMYDAISKGFARATGDVYAYINADDVFEPGAFAQIQKALETFPEIDWIKGTSALIDENSKRLREGRCFIYQQDWLARGIYGVRAYHVEQDSVFWRSSLWKRCGPIPAAYRLAGDYWLWTQFAKRAKLWSFNVPVSRFRKLPGQLSKQIAKYRSEQMQTGPRQSFIGIFFALRSKLAPYGFDWLFQILYTMLFPRTETYIALTDRALEKRTTRRFLVH